jgi:hypothetical protein
MERIVVTAVATAASVPSSLMRSSWRAQKLPNLAVMDPIRIMRIVAGDTEHHRADQKYDRQNERFRHDNLLAISFAEKDMSGRRRSQFAYK